MKFNHVNWGHPISSHGQPKCFFLNSYIFVNRFDDQVGGLELIVSILGWWSSRFKFFRTDRITFPQQKRLQKNRVIAGIIMDNIMDITEIFIQSYPWMIPMDNMNGTYYGYPIWSNKISEAEDIAIKSAPGTKAAAARDSVVSSFFNFLHSGRCRVWQGRIIHTQK